MHACLGGHTVDDVERVVVVQRSHATNTHRSRTRGVTVGLDVHARHAALQGFHRVVLVLLGHLVDAHRRDGARQVSLTLGGIARDHDLLQQLVVGRELHLHSIGCRYLLRLVSDVGDDEHGTLFHLNLEIAVEVSGGTIGRSFLLHGCTDDSIAELIDHRSRDLLLRVHTCTEQQSQETQQQSLCSFHFAFAFWLILLLIEICCKSTAQGRKSISNIVLYISKMIHETNIDYNDCFV